MQTNDEIRALVAECREEIRLFDRPQMSNSIRMLTAIETLLARQAEVLRVANECASTSSRLDLPYKIRAILNPETTK